jgi:molybdopterin molybdotransferase
MELLRVDTLDQARAKLLPLVRPLFTRTEPLPVEAALGRVLAADVTAADDIPGFIRSAVDGYAIIAADSVGASESMPVLLTLAGAVEMGAANDAGCILASGRCVYVPTGGMLPEGADAVCMVEFAESFGGGQIAVYKPLGTGENLVSATEDAARGDVLLSRGTRLSYRHIGCCAAAGVTQADCFARPRIALLSTGDELVSPNRLPAKGQVRDVNSWTLAAQAEQAGFEVTSSAVLPDDQGILLDAVKAASGDGDIVAMSGGSSQGAKDLTALVIAQAADQGVLTHGLALKPGKPTITGFDMRSQTLLLGLPGHPVAASMVFEALAGWLLREAQGTRQPLPMPATLACNLPAAPGRETLQLVSVEWQGDMAHGRLLATPIRAASGLVTRLARADGYIGLDRNTEGLPAGADVAVHGLSL